LAVAAVNFNISPVSKTNGAVKSSTVVFAATALTLNKLNTAVAALVKVTVIVSAFPESSETNIDLKIAVLAAGTVYNTVALVAVKSNLAFLYKFAIILKTKLEHQILSLHNFEQNQKLE
jgi:hypothetical protein